MREFEEFGVRLNKACKDAGVEGPSELAKVTGLNRVTLGAYMRGDRAASLEACVEIAKALNVDPYWLHSGTSNTILRGGQRIETREKYKTPKWTIRKDSDEPNADLNIPAKTTPDVNILHRPKNPLDSIARPATLRSIPLYSAALAGADGSISIGASVLEEIEAPAAVAAVPDAYAVRVVGESMEPRYQAGETVYIHPRMPVRRGDYVLVQVTEDGNHEAVMGYIKRLVQIDDKRIIVEQLNPEKELSFPRSRVKSVHKIVLAG